MFRRYGGVGFGFAVAALGWCFYDGAAQYDSCTSGTVADIGNGRCDEELNVPSCAFDAGDCCPCSCIDGPVHSCSDNDFSSCLYPDCGDAATTSGESTCIESFNGDGFCDPENRGPECDYDGGDVSL